MDEDSLENLSTHCSISVQAKLFPELNLVQAEYSDVLWA